MRRIVEGPPDRHQGSTARRPTPTDPARTGRHVPSGARRACPNGSRPKSILTEAQKPPQGVAEHRPSSITPSRTTPTRSDQAARPALVQLNRRSERLQLSRRSERPNRAQRQTHPAGPLALTLDVDNCRPRVPERTSAHQPAGFRPDVEGLRAIAILTVLWFHARLPFLDAASPGSTSSSSSPASSSPANSCAKSNAAGDSLARLLRPARQATLSGCGHRPRVHRHSDLAVSAPLAAGNLRRRHRGGRGMS